MINVSNYIRLESPNGKAKVMYSQFPAGEQYVKIEDIEHIKHSNYFNIIITNACSEVLFSSILLADAIKQISPTSIIKATLDYLPYGRQDRVCEEGESFSLKLFGEMLKLRFDKIESYDLHSDISLTIVDNIQINHFEKTYFSLVSKNKIELIKSIHKNSLIVAPDKGAINRANFLKNTINGNEIAYIDKFRDKGKIVSRIIGKDNIDKIKVAKIIVIPDDICDGGGTFIQAAKIIKELNPKVKLFLIISHGVFSKGFNELLNYYKDIYMPIDSYNNKYYL